MSASNSSRVWNVGPWRVIIGWEVLGARSKFNPWFSCAVDVHGDLNIFSIQVGNSALDVELYNHVWREDKEATE